MEKKAAARTRLEPGETSIDRNTPTQREDGTVVLGWAVRLRNCRLVRKRTQGAGVGVNFRLWRAFGGGWLAV
ncbi:hypothetical protein [Xylanimonas ulmi]|uniref:Uncharacterized protein n=1 Tax=Xylanimonas ulmi TaxID=228973 RepID=A0A4Q7LYR0_9MICO|nr:hypothetical protein [Xylanibacterium ulmi]RZS60014.1 hypothetical protein EV386_0254 [Xylanibacterium ulmi]